MGRELHAQSACQGSILVYIPFDCMAVHAGWKFWVPASVVNFWVVPLQYRVLWMSTCGLFWAGYLSYTSNT